MTWAGPYEIVNPEGRAAMTIICDHASNALPPELADLGVSPAGMQRHIAWDIGAAPIARYLAKAFDATAILCSTSRLVIDCNRQLSNPTLIPAVSDGTPIPANRDLQAAERSRRIAAYFTPYHDACRRVLDRKCGDGQRPLFISVHSMTERMNGVFRPWEISLSSNENRRATDAVLAALTAKLGLSAGDNQPYNMDPKEDYSTPEHALSRGLDYLQVEFRQDLVSTSSGQENYARIFADAVCHALLSNKMG